VQPKKLVRNFRETRVDGACLSPFISLTVLGGYFTLFCIFTSNFKLFLIINFAAVEILYRGHQSALSLESGIRIKCRQYKNSMQPQVWDGFHEGESMSLNIYDREFICAKGAQRRMLLSCQGAINSESLLSAQKSRPLVQPAHFQTKEGRFQRGLMRLQRHQRNKRTERHPRSGWRSISQKPRMPAQCTSGTQRIALEHTLRPYMVICLACLRHPWSLLDPA